MDVVIIGSGNVASVLVEKFIEIEKINIVQIFARNTIEGSNLACKTKNATTTNDPRTLAKADIYIIAVNDGSIASVSSKFDFSPNDIVVHTAGSVSMDELSSNIKNKGVLYPLQTFTKGVNVDLFTTPFLIEANNVKTLNTLREFASLISSQVIVVDSKQRVRIHVAAVFACNFVNHMLAISEQMCDAAGVEVDLLHPLVEQTIDKVLMYGEKAVDAQTGPAVRNDFRTKTRHLEQLDKEPILKNIYKIISQNIWETSKKI